MMEKPLSRREWAMIIINSVVSYCGLYWYPLIANPPHPCLDFDIAVEGEFPFQTIVCHAMRSLLRPKPAVWRRQWQVGRRRYLATVASDSRSDTIISGESHHWAHCEHLPTNNWLLVGRSMLS